MGELNVIYVDKLMQSCTTTNTQLIDGKLYNWCVRSHKIPLDISLQQWISEIRDAYKTDDFDRYLLIYDFQFVPGFDEEGFHSCPGFMLRTDIIKKI